MRSHGLELPFHPLQILSWAVLSLDVLVFAVLVIPVLGSDAARVLIAALFAASVVTLVIAGAKATLCDPVDPRVLRGAGKDAEGLEGELYKCPCCSCMVHRTSHHCRSCDKCVEDFDHHCMWLNNCIGRLNYRAFLWSIVSVAAMTGIILGSCVAVLVDFASCPLCFQQRLLDIYGSVSKDTVIGVLISLVVVNLPLWLLDVQLVILHTFLNFQQLTTFEYIIRKKEQLSMPAQGAETPAATRATLPRCLDWIVFSYRRARKARTIAPLDDSSREAGT